MQRSQKMVSKMVSTYFLFFSLGPWGKMIQFDGSHSFEPNRVGVFNHQQEMYGVDRGPSLDSSWYAFAEGFFCWKKVLGEMTCVFLGETHPPKTNIATWNPKHPLLMDVW